MVVEILLPTGRRFETVMNTLPKVGDELGVIEGEFVIAEVTYVVKDHVAYISARLEEPKVAHG